MSIPELRTERLVLRPLTMDDVEAMHTLWTLADVRRYLWDGDLISEERAAEAVEASMASATQYGIGIWNMMLDGAVIGFCGLRTMDDNGVELLCGLHPDHWKKGYATEASRAVMRYAFAVVHDDRIWARMDEPNTASLRLCERLGMTYAGRETSGGLPMVRYVLERPR